MKRPVPIKMPVSAKNIWNICSGVDIVNTMSMSSSTSKRTVRIIKEKANISSLVPVLSLSIAMRFALRVILIK